MGSSSSDNSEMVQAAGFERIVNTDYSQVWGGGMTGS